MLTVVTILFTSLAVYICAFAKAETIETKGGKITLGYTKPGLISNDYIFKNAAEEACPTGYQVLAKTTEPDTLSAIDPDKLYWIIQCENNQT